MSHGQSTAGDHNPFTHDPAAQNLSGFNRPSLYSDPEAPKAHIIVG